MVMRTVYYQLTNLPVLDYRNSEVGDKANESVRASVYQFCPYLPLLTPVGLNFEKSFLSGCLHHKTKLLSKFHTQLQLFRLGDDESLRTSHFIYIDIEIY